MDAFIDTLMREMWVDWAGRLRSELTNRGITDPIEWDGWVGYVTARIVREFQLHADAQRRLALHEG